MNKLLKKSIYLPYFFMATGIFILPHADKKAVLFFTFGMFSSLFYSNIKHIKMNIKKPIMLTLLLLTTYSLFGYYFYPDGSRDIRALLCLLFYFTIIPHNEIKIKNLVYILVIAGVFSFLNTSYYTYFLQLNRETGFLNPNIYAGLTGALAVAAFSLLLTGYNKILCSISYALLLSSTLLTQSRTVISVTIVISFLLLILSKRISIKNILIFLSLMILPLYIFNHQIESRYNTTKEEIRSLETGNLNSSMGLRLEMWQYAPTVITENLLIGVGGEHKEYLKKAYKQGEISKELYKFNPPGYHNEIINRMVKNGLIGTLLLLMFYIIPIYQGSKQTLDKKLLLWAVTGFYIISGVTLSPLTQGSTILLYGLLVIPFCCDFTQRNLSIIEEKIKSR